ncbi:MAG: hypothetical protein WBM17_10350 [Anaerolineales bacterium]
MPAEFDALNRFILPAFPAKRPFSSFLPGIAGPLGIPMWVFYVNRGQGIAGFGVESKDSSLMEFQPAQRAYQSTALLGFRTFLRGRRNGLAWTHEPFSPWQDGDAERTMYIGLNEFEIEERHAGLGLQVNVLYFVLPGEPFAGLVRRVSLENMGSSPLALELLDGLPALIPFGADNGSLKRMGRTLEAWMEVVHHRERLPFYRLKASPGDSLHVRAINAGNYALAFLEGELLPVAVDPQVIFGMDTTLAFPRIFLDAGLPAVMEAAQTTQGRTPCALFGAQLEIPPGAKRVITSLYGQFSQVETLSAGVAPLLVPGAISAKLDQARRLTLDLTDAIRTASASPLFDGYCRQTFLDNLMRGGYPLVLGGKHIYHIYSRRHGDLERDYNPFVLDPEFYSQGEGNYRDINQNRRNDVFFVPQAGEFNLRLFMSLIQADGFNPLVVKGVTFTLPPEAIPALLDSAGEPAVLKEVLAGPFTPGQLLAAAQQAGLRTSAQDFLEQVLGRARQNIRAAHGEGYWTDHWTYNLDLIESFLTVHPEKRRQILFDSDPLAFFDSAVNIRPRDERFVLDEGRPRQTNALAPDPEKAALIDGREEFACWARTDHGRGEIFRLPLFSKLVLLAALKFAALDASGLGVQMEAGRPGWCDALNGLPALFGSSMAETYELLRLVEFLVEALAETPRETELPVEASDLLRAIRYVLTNDLPAFDGWERLSSALEGYREATRLGFDGATERPVLVDLLRDMHRRLQDGIARAESLAEDFPPTYFMHTVKSYERTGRNDAQGRPLIRVTAFEPAALPPFLEGAVRRMRTLGPEDVRSLHARVRDSSLFDNKLRMYRLNASLEALPHEIGRARAFTPGWLENESVWMHMEFKYLLELLRAGLYKEFYADLKNSLPAFLDPEIYGRSPLENSSFIASSAHPDPAMHGNGFVARLSGSTAEFLSLWVRMTAGPQPFRLSGDALFLDLRPALPGWLFREDGTFSFRFLGLCEITYHNPARKDTFADGISARRFVLHPRGGEPVILEGDVVLPPYAAMLRDGEIGKIDIFF